MRIYDFSIESYEGDFIISKNELNRAFNALERSNLFQNFENPDGVSVWMEGKGVCNVSFLWTWEKEEEDFPPTWYNFQVIVRKDYFIINKMGGTCYPIPCDPGYEKTWKLNWEGELLWESPSQGGKRGSRPCRK